MSSLREGVKKLDFLRVMSKGDKKRFIFYFLYFIRTCTQTWDDNTEKLFKKKEFQGMLNIFFCGRGVDRDRDDLPYGGGGSKGTLF